jgi:FdhD protein
MEFFPEEDQSLLQNPCASDSSLVPSVEPVGWVEAWKWNQGEGGFSQESLALESPLEIRLEGKPFTLSLRSPGDDPDLILGLLFAEGVIEAASDCLSLSPVVGSSAAEIWNVVLKPGLSAQYFQAQRRKDQNPIATESNRMELNRMDLNLKHSEFSKTNSNANSNSEEGELRDRRAFASTSSCGLCGKTAWEDAVAPARGLRSSSLSLKMLFQGYARMEKAQGEFERTGGTHAAAALDAAGRLLAFAEDIGRHNAVDKVVGRLLSEGRLESSVALLASGRLSYEITAKAYRAGFPLLAGVSAPSSLAVASAQAFGLTLLGFCREPRATIYSGVERLPEFQIRKKKKESIIKESIFSASDLPFQNRPLEKLG